VCMYICKCICICAYVDIHVNSEKRLHLNSYCMPHGESPAPGAPVFFVALGMESRASHILGKHFTT
jgi:hypothetical protein